MSRPRCGSLISRGLLAVAFTLVLAAVAVASVKTGSYSGSTKQHRKITFSVARQIGSDAVNGVAFQINDTCPDKHILRVTVGKNYFPSLKVDSKGRFGATVHPPNAANQPTSIKGTISGKTTTGTISDTTMSAKEHKLCHGRTTFTAKTK